MVTENVGKKGRGVMVGLWQTEEYMLYLKAFTSTFISVLVLARQNRAVKYLSVCRV